jgi:hypothetical protein
LKKASSSSRRPRATTPATSGREALVGEERVARERLVLGLVVHVLAAAGEHRREQRGGERTR